MNQNNCFYCIKDERLSNLMIPVCTFSTSTLYLFKDQRYPGRCVLASTNTIMKFLNYHTKSEKQ